MPRRPRDAEIIELLPLDDAPDWLADDVATSPTAFTPPGRSRRTAALGVVAVVAIGAAAIWLSSTDDDQTAATSTTSTTPPTSTTVVAPDPATLPTNLVLDDIVGLQPYLAENPATPSPDADTRNQLWRSIEGDVYVLVESRLIDFERTDAPAPEFDGLPRPGVIRPALNVIGALDDPARTVIRYEPDGWSIRIEARGVPDEALVSFAISVEITPSGPEFDSKLLPLVISVASSRSGTARDALYGAVDSRTVYWSVGTRQLVTLSTGLSSLGDRRSVQPVMITGRQESNGRSWGRLTADPTTSIVQWPLDDDRLATATARMAPEMLLALTSRAREATAQEWRSLVYGLRPDYRIGSFTTVASDINENGVWEAGVQRAARRDTDELLWWWSIPFRASSTSLTSTSMPARRDISQRPQFATVVYPDVTYVLASVPAGDPAQTVRLSSLGVPLDEATLVAPYNGAPVRVAIFAVTDAVPLEVVTLDPDGSERLLAGGATPQPDLVTVPEGFRLADATTLDADTAEDEPFEIWTNATGDQWFIASSSEAGQASTDPDGTLQRRVIRGDRWDVTIDASGLSADTLDQLAESASAIGGRVVFRTTPFEFGFSPVVNGSSRTHALLGVPLLQVTYDVAGSDRAPIYLVIGTDSTLTSAYQPYAIAGLQSGQLPDRSGSWVGGTLHTNPELTVLQWNRGGLQYTLAGGEGLPQLLAMIGFSG